MAKKRVSDELQEAILSLPSKEKNKLLIRLINKDELLVEQLQFKLLENTAADLRFRINEIKRAADDLFQKVDFRYYKDLLYYTRDLVTHVNRYFKVTKDKKGELELLIYVLIQASENTHNLKPNLRDLAFKTKFKDYGLNKITKLNTLVDSLHEDYKVEFEDEIMLLTDFFKRL